MICIWSVVSGWVGGRTEVRCGIDVEYGFPGLLITMDILLFHEDHFRCVSELVDVLLSSNLWDMYSCAVKVRTKVLARTRWLPVHAIHLSQRTHKNKNSQRRSLIICKEGHS